MENETVIQPTKRRGRPKGTDRFKLQQSVAQVIQNNPGISGRELAETAEVAPSTARAYLAKYGINKGEIDLFVDNRVDIVRSKQQMILDNMTEAKIKGAAFRDMAVAYGILLDKDRLESGQSTQNIASWTKVVTDSHVVDKSKTVDI